MKAPKNIRGLNPQEKMLAFTVFQNTIPWETIRLTDGLGYDNREFTIKVSPNSFGPGGAIGDAITKKLLGYSGVDYFIFLNVGPVIYKNAFLNRPATFIHEMTHAWQYVHGNHVVLDSLYNQAKASVHGTDAYAYTPGQAWDSYNVEQQAHIVEDWFKSHKNKAARQKYMENNIWKGKIK